MKNKCKKYYSLFVFRSTDELNKHIEKCDECKNTQNELSRVENLIRFSKPAYLKRKNNLNFFNTNKIVSCFAFIFILSFLSGNSNEIYLINHRISHPEIAVYTSTSIFNNLNLPTDELGLLDVNKKFYYE